jgi:hypothetical protein
MTSEGEEHMIPWSQKSTEQKLEAVIRHYKKEIELFKQENDPLQLVGIYESFVRGLETILEKNT